MSDTNPLGVPAHRHTNPDGSEGGWVADTATVAPTVHIGRDAWVSGDAWVYGLALVSEPRHILTIGPIGSEDQTITLARTHDGHTLTIGCWQNGAIDQLKAEVMKRAPQHWPEYKAARALLRLRAAEWDAARNGGEA